VEPGVRELGVHPKGLGQDGVNPSPKAGKHIGKGIGDKGRRKWHILDRYVWGMSPTQVRPHTGEQGRYVRAWL
jgi:hypothetical protein